MYVDIGVYGTPLKENFDNTSALPLLEKFVIEHQGCQALYAIKPTQERGYSFEPHKNKDHIQTVGL
jgi:delta24-sterol reductase